MQLDCAHIPYEESCALLWPVSEDIDHKVSTVLGLNNTPLYP